MRNRSREEFEGSDALKDLGIRIANSVGLYGNTQQLIENDRAAKSIRKEIKRAERRLQATDAEKNFASGVAAGIYGEADIPPSMDADTVMELADYYWAEKAVQNDLIREQRTKINRNLDERVRRLMDGVDDAKTKVPAASSCGTGPRNGICGGSSATPRATRSTTTSSGLSRTTRRSASAS